MEHDLLDREHVSAVALRLVDLGWLRVGGERYAKESRTYGVTTLQKRHVTVRGKRVKLCFRGKHGVQVRTSVVDEELADSVRGLLALKGGGRLFRYEWEGDRYNLTGKRLNDYVRIYLGEEFTAKDFRTWGGTLEAAIALAEADPARDRDGGEEDRRGGDAARRSAPRQYTGRCARVLRQPGRRRAVSRRDHDRRLSPAAFARGRGA